MTSLLKAQKLLKSRLGLRAPLRSALLAVVVLSACERDSRPDSSRATTPQQAFRLQFELMNRNDGDALWELYSDRAQAECASARQVSKQPRPQLSLKDFCTQSMTSPVKVLEPDSVKISEDGSSAVVLYGPEGDVPQRFVKHGALWKADERPGIVPAGSSGIDFRVGHPGGNSR